MNVAGKQEYLAERADKLTNIFRQIFANPAVLQAPGMGKLFNEIIESAGFSPIEFSSFTAPVQQMNKPQETTTPAPQPLPVTA